MTYKELIAELATFSDDELNQSVSIEDVRGELYNVQYMVRSHLYYKDVGNFLRLFQWDIDGMKNIMSN